jgi:hypothetical protein
MRTATALYLDLGPLVRFELQVQLLKQPKIEYDMAAGTCMKVAEAICRPQVLPLAADCVHAGA